MRPSKSGASQPISPECGVFANDSGVPVAELELSDTASFSGPTRMAVNEAYQTKLLALLEAYLVADMDMTTHDECSCRNGPTRRLTSGHEKSLMLTDHVSEARTPSFVRPRHDDHVA